MEELKNSWNGYATFLDIENPVLRIQNQAVVLANIIEDNRRNLYDTQRLSTGYFENIPLLDRERVLETTKAVLEVRGYTLKEGTYGKDLQN